jgi:hypothetical protein
MSNSVKYKSAGKKTDKPKKFNLFKISKYFFGVLFILLAGIAAGRLTNSTETKKVSEVQVTNKEFIGDIISKAGPDAKAKVVQTGYAKTKDGAVAAASSYLMSFPRMYFLKEALVKEELKKITTEESYEKIYLRLQQTGEAVNIKLIDKKESSFFRSIPVGYSVFSESKEKIKVTVWTIDFWAVEENVDPQVVSNSSTVSLVWQNKDWKVADVETTDGPTALWLTRSQPQTVKEFVDSAEGFGGFDYVPNI